MALDRLQGVLSTFGTFFLFGYSSIWVQDLRSASSFYCISKLFFTAVRLPKLTHQLPEGGIASHDGLPTALALPLRAKKPDAPDFAREFQLSLICPLVYIHISLIEQLLWECVPRQFSAHRKHCGAQLFGFPIRPDQLIR